VGIVVLAVTIGILLWALFAALRPLPERDLAMATGAPGTAYARLAEQYREVLARDGVRLRLVPTTGAVDNVRLLSDAHSGIAAGFVQAGAIAPSARQKLVSLGTLFYEEMWVFCRCPEHTVPARDWNGWRVSIGPEGSSTHPLALKILALNGLDAAKLRLSSYAPESAEQALLARQLDAALILTGWESPVVQRLIHEPGITLLGFPRAAAYTALVPVLSKVVLPMGVIDLGANRPPEDTTLIASKASLAVRKDLHPALQFLLLRAAMEVHSRPGVFERAGEFPAAEEIDLPLSKEARELYRAGPTFLQRTMPFWLAELVQRMLILILPFAGIIYPLWSLAPKIYYWIMQRRLSPMFHELRLIERELRASGPETQRALLARLDDLDRRARDLPMPGHLSEPTYNLWANIQALRERVRDSQAPSDWASHDHPLSGERLSKRG
jgi:TRAP-type uncharacterized transport system substrate-binding protein